MKLSLKMRQNIWLWAKIGAVFACFAFVLGQCSLTAWRLSNLSDPRNFPWEERWAVYVTSTSWTDKPIKFLRDAATLEKCRSHAEAYRAGWLQFGGDAKSIQHLCVRKCRPFEKSNLAMGDQATACLVGAP